VIKYLIIVFVLWGLSAITGQTAPEYQIYAGNTHSHTSETWSHGDQWATNGCTGILVYANKAWSDGYVTSKTGCSGIFVINGLQYPSPSLKLKPDWQKLQGSPADHFALAKANGYDFYAVTDHSQEAGLQSLGPDNPGWDKLKQAAANATDHNYVALPGFEFSENNGQAKGHLNVINSAGILNALAAGVDIPYFYRWLATAPANSSGPVVASFNHPDAHQYNDWAYRDPQVTDVLTMLEVINSNNKIHYEAFINALDKGWKVSPVCGNDNHGLGGITKHTSRTFVLAKAKDRASILEAMKNRRTYASLDGNLQCRYTVNGRIMGSTLDHPSSLQFNISISDPDKENPKDKITKVDIVTNGGVVVETYTPSAPEDSVQWNPLIHDTKGTYFFVRVWNSGGGDAAGADPAKPVAWLAPVWTGR
jgi:hypothetical protein